MKQFLYILVVIFSTSVLAAEPSNKAKDWQLKTQSGKDISSYQYEDKPIILHFWATWCPYCKKLQPKLVELQEKYSDQDLEIVSISFNEDSGAMPEDVLRERGYKFETAVNGDHVAIQYGVIGTPTTFFINRDGDIIFKSTSSEINDPRLELAVIEIVKH